MNFVNLILWPWANLRNAVLAVAAWSWEQVEDIFNAFMVLLAAVLSLTIWGVAMSFGFYHLHDLFGFHFLTYGIDFGEFLVALAGIMSGIFWIYLMLRVYALAGLAAKLSEAVSKAVEEISRPLPGEPIRIPVVIKDEDVQALMHKVASAFACITLVSCYAGVIPVYHSLTGFCLVVLLGYFVSFAAYAWNIPDKWHLKEKLVTTAGVLILVITINYFVPSLVRDRVREYTEHRLVIEADKNRSQQTLEEAAERARKSAQPALLKGIAVLEQQRNNLLAKMALNPTQRSETDSQELRKINAAIAELESQKILSDTEEEELGYNEFGSPQVSGWWIAFAAVLLVVGIVLQARNSSGHKPVAAKPAAHH